MGFDGTTPFASLYAYCAVDDDEKAWGELIRRFDPFVARVVAGTYHVLSPERWGAEDVEDAAQEAWYRLMREDRRHIRSFPERSEGEFKVYLRTTAVNVVRDRLKTESVQKRPRIAQLGEETQEYLIGIAADPVPAPDEQVHVQLIAERVEPLLRRVWADRPHLDRDLTICALALVEGLSAQKIADIKSIALSRGGVEKVIGRGRKVLRQHFAGPGARSRFLRGPAGTGPEPVEAWRDVDEVLDFVLGTLDPDTVKRRMHLLSRDGEALSVLHAVTLALDAPLEATLAESLGSRDAVEIYRTVKARIRRESWGRILPRWRRIEATRAVWATAAILLVLLGPLLGPHPPPEPASRSSLPAIEYPEAVSTPLRLAQPFSPESDGPRRGESARMDEEKMLEVEEQLILERGRGADQVATSNALGHLKLARGQLGLAERNYLTALKHDPNNAETLIGLAVVNYQRAVRTLTESPAEEAEATSARLLAKAESALARVEPSSSFYIQALFNRIQVALAAGELEIAESLLARYENLAPDDGWASALRAAVQSAGG